jgi:hypothetical protein
VAVTLLFHGYSLELLGQTDVCGEPTPGYQESMLGMLTLAFVAAHTHFSLDGK